MSFLEIFELNELWSSIGPLILGIIVIVLLGLILGLTIALLPDGNFKDVAKKISPFIIIGGFLFTLYISAQIWGWI